LLLIVNVVVSNFIKILIFFAFLPVSQTFANEIWAERFLVPGKGIWGGDNGSSFNQDFSGITAWMLDFSGVTLLNSGDYAKTVTTGGGRFEVCDIEGQVSWRSEWIKIKNFKEVIIQLAANETGSGANQEAKYLKAFFRINNSEEVLFETAGQNYGNWGSATAIQTGLSGDSLQVVVYLANSYSSDKVILDEVIVSGESTEVPAPSVTKAEIISADSLEVFFDLPVQPVSIENFRIQNDLGESIYIISAIRSEGQHNLIFLNILPANRDKLTLKTIGIVGENGASADSSVYNFDYLPPVKPHDVVFNEIMADPSPPQLLPESEFIELFNRSDYPANLQGMILKVRDTEKSLGAFILMPDSFVVLCPTSAAEALSAFSNVLPVPGFPSLINSGANLQLKNKNGDEIDAINYSEGWYNSETKNAGGWSLERIDPGRFCGQSANWKASEAPEGGTPGNQNSVKAENPDNQPPFVVWGTAISASKAEVIFSEPMDSMQLKNPQNYSLSGGIGNPGSIEMVSLTQVFLHFVSPLNVGAEYFLEMKNLADECGNPIETAEPTIIWDELLPGDLAINEVLFNPYPEGADFVELVNCSDKKIALNRLKLATRNDTLGLKQIYRVSESRDLLAPGKYLLCTADSLGVTAFYFSECPACFVEMPSFPAFSNDEGYVVLLGENNQVLDEFRYSESMHSAFLNYREGVSLERVSCAEPANQPGNWYSASENSGFATPGYKNSQAGKGNRLSVVFEPESFSPNNDGYNDEYIISYFLPEPGYAANIWIFDTSGAFVFQLGKNELLGTEGQIAWNGCDETGSRLPFGAYVVVAELFNLKGDVKRFKDAVVLTGILE